MRTVLFLLIAMSSAVFAQDPPVGPGVSHELAQWRAAWYSDVRYKLDLTLEKMSPVLKGTIEIRLNVKSPDGRQLTDQEIFNTLPIVLDWRTIPGHEADSTVSNVSINGTPVMPIRMMTPVRDPAKHYYQERSEHLIFQEGVKIGENVIKLDFTSPILTSGSAITRYVDKEDGSEYLYSLFVPSDASTAFPVFDQPDLKARFQLTVWRPESWKVVSNTQGTQIGVQDGVSLPNEPAREMSQNTTFTETKPISTYVFAFAAGPWVEFDEAGGAGGNLSGREGVPAGQSIPRNATAQRDTLPTGRVSASDAKLSTHIYVRRSQAEKFKSHASEVFRLTREGIKFLEEYFDYKFPFPKYDIVLIPEFPFGGMEHAGATFLREASVIFPSEPTANDYISRANVIFHEAAHQWFGDTVTMRWFDDLWLKEGFAEFMAYKTLEKVMPQYNAWKAFYERNKPAAYFTDSTRGTTPIYQPIDNLSAAKSAYGNIVYRKAPSFLRQAEFYLGPDKFQTAVRAFLKKHAYANATWQDLVSEFEIANGKKTDIPRSLTEDQKYTVKKYEQAMGTDLSTWAKEWVTEPEVFRIRIGKKWPNDKRQLYSFFREINNEGEDVCRPMKFRLFVRFENGKSNVTDVRTACDPLAYDPKKFYLEAINGITLDPKKKFGEPLLIFPNYQDYGYGIFLLDDKSREYVLKNIQNEKDDFLRSMMWGTLWDSVREGELDPREYVELAIKNLPAEKDETITASVLGRVSTAMTYYIGDKQRDGIAPRLENMLIEKMRTAPTLGQRITFYRAFLNVASTENARNVLKAMLRNPGGNLSGSEGVPARTGSPRGSTAQRDTLPTGRVSASAPAIPLKTKDRFDIVTKLAILGDPEAPRLLADLEKAETSDDAKRYAYAARAAFATKENREKFWNDFVNNKDISESWIEAALAPFNSPRHSELSLPYLERALKELPNLKRSRKIFFVNGWLGAFIGGQKSQQALDIVNKFLADNTDLDRDLRLKVLENVDVIERAVKIRSKWGN